MIIVVDCSYLYTKIVIFLEIGKKKSNYFLHKIKFHNFFDLENTESRFVKEGYKPRRKRWPYKQ